MRQWVLLNLPHLPKEQSAKNAVSYKIVSRLSDVRTVGQGFNEFELCYHGPGPARWLCSSYGDSDTYALTIFVRCGRDWCQKNACPISGYVYSTKGEEEDEPPSWINCDSCGAWVVAECDGIGALDARSYVALK